MKYITKILIIFILIIFISGCSLINREEYDNVDNYNKYLDELKNNTDVRSGLFIFPESIDLDNIIDFKYIREDGFFDGSYLFYLICKYDDTSYKNELDRIKNINIKYDGLIKTPLIYNNTYVTINDGYGTYEYVIFDDEENVVVYILNQLLDFDSLDDKYILNYKVEKDKRDTKRPGYNMYYNYNSSGDGVSFDETPPKNFWK